jgi:uncharacterized protein
MALCFPKAILEQHLVVLGKTGAGKSSALRHVVEYLLSHNKRVCIIDPKGDWWGLKSSADGKSAGYGVVAFGDFKNEKASDVPINAQSGKHVAELITSGNRPAMIGFRGWMTSHMVQFWIDFASGIFNANSGELYLIGDEFHNFAPKGRIMDPQAGKCLHWSNRLLSEGRGLGIVCLIASQRPQKVHNDTLTSCETLVAMRVIHAADRGAVEDWIKGCGDKERGKEVLNSLASMARGEAFVWSPEIDFGPKRIEFPMFETFDSFAPPQLQKKISERGWADVDLDEVKQKLSSVIEEAKANDPRELKKQIAHLKSEMVKAPKQVAAQPKIEIQEKEVPILKDSQVKRLEKVAERMYSEADRHGKAMSFLWGNFNEIGEALKTALETLSGQKPRLHVLPSSQSHRPGPPMPRPEPKPVAKMAALSGNNGNTPLSKCERSILSALAQYPQGRSSTQVAILTGYSGQSGGFNNSLSKLRSNGFITRSNPIQISEEGLLVLGDWEPLPTGQGLLRHWIGRLSKCERSILETLASNYPNALTTEELGEATGYSASSGGFNNSLSRLRTLELINRGQPIQISEEFYQ